MSQEGIYDFEWDPGKAQSNLRKHGVSFDQAATVFLDALALTVYDVSGSRSEEPWFTVGFGADGRLLAIAHTYQQIDGGRARIRIISARPATRHERRSYEEEPR